MKRLNLEGNRYGKLTVVRFSDVVNGTGTWLCKCDCGNEIISKGWLLKKGAIKSCGCYRRDLGKHKNRTHGLSNFRPYYVWKDMKRRCYDKTRPEYKNYGGRGIKICTEWLNSVEKFCEWARKSGYKKGLTIERVNNNMDYCPENCKWVSMKEQLNNNRRNNFLKINGITKTISQWSQKTGIKYDTLWSRVNKGYSDVDLIKPVDKRYSHVHKSR